jgi:DNA-binding protein H-NS
MRLGWIDFREIVMAKVNLNDMDVDALLTLRADVGKALAERSRDLQRQLAMLGGEVGKRRGRPPGRAGRPNVMKGKKVAPKYRGPGGETWAGRDATPRWLAALLKEGHSIEEFALGKGGRRAAAAKKSAAKKGRKAAPKKRRLQKSEAKAEPATVA